MSPQTYIGSPSLNRNFPISSSRPDVAIGIVLPIGNAETGQFFKQSYTTIEQAKSNIKNLILTTRGERIMHPQLGTGLWNILFEPMEQDTFEIQVKNTILENVKMWLPYIAITDLVVTTDYDNNTVNISMTIALKNDPQIKDTLFLSISKGDV